MPLHISPLFKTSIFLYVHFSILYPKNSYTVSKHLLLFAAYNIKQNKDNSRYGIST